MYASSSFTFNADTVISHEYSNVYEITASGTFIVPVTGEYEIVAIGGGGGGGGGGGSILWGSVSARGGNGGNGGDGGQIKAWRQNLTKNQSINVTIGQGGSGGRGGASNGGTGGTGTAGGATIFGTTSVSGGKGGSGGSYPSLNRVRQGGNGGRGGNGSNSTNMDIFGEAKAYGQGGSGGNGGYLATNNVLIVDPTDGARVPPIYLTLLKGYADDFYVDHGGGGGYGGDGGDISESSWGDNSGYTSRGGYGGKGGDGLLMRIANVTTKMYGQGGDGNYGGDYLYNSPSDTYSSKAGNTGRTGAKGYIILRAVHL